MTLATTRFTQALLDLEDAGPDVLFESLPGAVAPLWPQVRMNLSYALSEAEFTSVIVARRTSRAAPLVRAARSFLPSRWDAVGLTQERRVAFVTGGVTVARTPTGLRNWLIGDFAEAFAEESVILQWPPIRSQEGQAFPLTRTLDPLNARAEVRTRLRRPASHESLVRRLVGEYARLLGGAVREDQLESITASAIYGARISTSFDREFDRILDRLRPRVVLIDSPVDGGRGAMIASMKKRGILVVEPQHGWIGPGHGAYNFGAAMRRPELSIEVPDELLTFGRYWNDGLRYPGVVTTIGKPQFERAVAAAPPVDERPRTILVVSSVGEPERTCEFVLALADALPIGWNIRFRPHPSELVALAQRYPALLADNRVTIDRRGEVYESLAASRIVIGVASTVLFEAAGMGCGVFVRDTPYVPFIVGDLFGAPLRGEAGIARVMVAAADNAPGREQLRVGRTELWEPESVLNYRRWIAERVPGAME